MTWQYRKSLLRLYPAAWRERYSDEFDALLEQRPLLARDVVDVVRGGLDARLHDHCGRNVMRTAFIRLAGLSLLLAGFLWILGTINRYGVLLSPSPFPTFTGTLTPSDVMRGYIPLLLLIGMAGVWYRGQSSGRLTAPVSLTFACVEGGIAVYLLAWTAERVLGVSWYTSALRHDAIAFGTGCLCLGILVMGIALFRRHVLPVWSLIPLAAGMLGFIGLVVAVFASNPTVTNQLIFRGQVYVYLAFGLAWLPLGLVLFVSGSTSGRSNQPPGLGTG